MGNKRSRLASRAGGSAWARVHHARELQRQRAAAQVLLGAGARRPPSLLKLRLFGLAFFVLAAAVGAGVALLVHR